MTNDILAYSINSNKMDKANLLKLKNNLQKRIENIDKELSAIASENPLVRGDFDVRVDNLGESQEDTAQEAGELDRQQALVDALERKRKEIVATIDKIDSGKYGKCDNCSAEISPNRLRAVPVAALCITCASQKR